MYLPKIHVFNDNRRPHFDICLGDGGNKKQHLCERHQLSPETFYIGLLLYGVLILLGVFMSDCLARIWELPLHMYQLVPPPL